MRKQLFEIEVQAHTNRKEVDGVRAQVKHILKQHDRAMNTAGGETNMRIISARVQDQVTAVKNVLKSHEAVLGGLEDLNSSCKFVFNCLRTRYPGLQIFKENKNKNYTSSNLPQLVISGLDSGIGKDGNDYFMNENSIYQSDAGGVYDSSRKGFIDGIHRKQPAWIRGHLDTLNSSEIDSSVYENNLTRTITPTSSQYTQPESKFQQSSVSKSPQKFVMQTLRRNMPSSLKMKTSKRRQRNTNNKNRRRRRPNTVANSQLSYPMGMEKRAWSSQASLSSNSTIEAMPHVPRMITYV